MLEHSVDLSWDALATGADDHLRVGLGRLPNGTAVSAEPLAPVLAIGPPQSRKTSGVVTPAVQKWAGPVVVVTSSAESVDRTVEARRRVGQVWVLDPYDVLPAWSVKAGWSPLDEINTWNDAQRLATRLLDAKVPGLQDGDFWRAAAAQLLAPHMYAAAKNGRAMRDVIRWIRTQEEFEVRSLLQAIGEDEPIIAAEAGWQREDRARSSIYTTVDVHLRAWTDESISQFSDLHHRFRSANFLDGKPNTVYIVLPGAEDDSIAAMSTALIQHLVGGITQHNRGFSSHLVQSAGIVAALENSPTRVTPVLVAVDDAGTLAPMASLSALTAAAARHAIQIIAVFADVSEIEMVFGQAAANTYINRHLAILFTPGTRDLRTLDLVRNLQSHLNWSDSRDDRLLEQGDGGAGKLSDPVLNNLPRGSALCFYPTLRPAAVRISSAKS